MVAISQRGKQTRMTAREQVEQIRSLAQAGNGKAQHNLGAMYLSGQGVEKDLKQAMYWFVLAARRGIVLAQHNVGVFYLRGMGVAPDPVQAAYWFEEAAMQGDPRSQHSLGALYFEGLGVEKSLEKAYVWLSFAVQGAPEERRGDMLSLRDFVASQLSPEEREWARNRAVEIAKKMVLREGL